MARNPRIVSGTGIYHVMMRGINRQNIFEDTDDYIRFREILLQMVNPTDALTRGLECCEVYGPVSNVYNSSVNPCKQKSIISWKFQG